MPDVRLSVAIMAHPSRQEMVWPLLDRLDVEPSDVVVVMDERNVEWDTGRRALLAYEPDCTHHLVIQDDAIVCRDLVAGLTRGIERLGLLESPMALYWGDHGSSVAIQAREAIAYKREQNFWLGPGPTWGVSVVIPTSQIDALVAGCDATPGVRQYDTLMDRWYRRKKMLCAYTRPSLVDHMQSPSLLGHKDGRHAHEFIGADASALDWAEGVGPGNGYVGPVPLTLGSRQLWVCSECATWRPEEASIALHIKRYHPEGATNARAM